MKQSDILIRPFVSEKAMNQVSGTPTQDFKDGNKIQFIVHRDADKADIKAVFEDRYEVKVEKIWTVKWDERQKTYDRLYDFTQETFTGIRVIKAFVKEAQELRAFSKVAQTNADKNLEFTRSAIRFDVYIEVIIGATMSLLLGVGSYFVYRNSLNDPFVLIPDGAVRPIGNNYKIYLTGEEVKLKKYFYALRPVLAARWVLEEATAPPMLFDDLVAAKLPADLKPTVADLVELKKGTPEIGTGKQITELNNYITTQLAELEAAAGRVENRKSGWDELEDYFRSAVMEE